MIYYVVKWMKTLSLTVSSFASTSLSHCFSLLSAFLYSKPFRNNTMHCEIIDRHFNVFFVEIQLKKGNLKSVLWALEFGLPNRYTGLPNSLNTSLIVGNPHLYGRVWGFKIVLQKRGSDFSCKKVGFGKIGEEGRCFKNTGITYLHTN